MISGEWRLLAGSALCLATLVGISTLIAINDRITGPTSQELIAQLVSSNPRSTGRWDEERPASWNHAEDERVQRVIASLRKDPRRHMDALIANSDRQEFTTTMSTAVPYSPVTVGDVCGSIISSHFYRYCPRSAYADGDRSIKKSSRSYFDAMDKGRLTSWWANNHLKSDQEIGNLIAEWHRAEPSTRATP